MRLVRFDDSGVLIALDGDGADLCAILRQGIDADPVIMTLDRRSAEKTHDLIREKVGAGDADMRVTREIWSDVASIVLAVQTTAPDDFAVPEARLDALSEQIYEILETVRSVPIYSGLRA